jgi:hypothetical protein
MSDLLIVEFRMIPTVAAVYNRPYSQRLIPVSSNHENSEILKRRNSE